MKNRREKNGGGRGGCLTSGTCISVCVCVSVGIKMGSHIAQAKLERKDVLELLTLSPEC